MKRYQMMISIAIVLLCMAIPECLADGVTTTLQKIMESQDVSYTPENAASDAAKRHLREEFLVQYEVWMHDRVLYAEKYPTSSSGAFPSGVVKMGAPIIPIIIDIFIQDGKDDNLSPNEQMRLLSVVHLLTFKGFNPDKYGKQTLSQEMQLYVKWWNEDRKQTPLILKKMYGKWDSLMDDGKTYDANIILEDIRYMGIDALPFVIGKIKHGDDRLLKFVSKLARDYTLGDNPSRSDILSWWKKNKERLTLPAPEPVGSSRTKK